MKKPSIYHYRKIHRYLGLIIGIQFIFWTLGGLFFAWSDIDQIHGDPNRKSEPLISKFDNWTNPSDVFQNISLDTPIDSLISFNTINFLEHPYYQIRFISSTEQRIALVDVNTGVVRSPLNKKEAEDVAISGFTPKSEILSTTYLTSNMVGKHHEYRGQPLPAFAIKFLHKSGSTVYVSTEFGTITTLRNSNWRIFDFMWMMHTMDYNSRDNFGNILLRAFSILGLITILSGFTLFFNGLILKRERNKK